MSVIETATSYFERLIQSDEFYFQKGKDALEKWMDLYLSNEGQVELQNLLEDYTAFAEIREGHQFFSIKEILFSIISYCDIHARGKAIYNQYDDKRVLAKAGVRMKPWVINTFNYKYHKDDVNITVKNALDMLAMPENNINSIALSHRELISNHYLNHSYNPDTFVSELKEKFSDLDRTKNPENQTLLIAAHIYDQKKEWDKKQMDFKTFIANLKEYAEKNQLEYGFGDLKGNNIWIFDKEQHFNHKRAHYEVIVKKGSISVDLHFEDENENAEIMRALLGTLPSFLEWKKWHFGNSVSHIKKFTLSDEDLVEKVVECLDELYDATSEKLIASIKTMKSELNMNNTILHPLNQILYGPPGTGKTYNTINKAIQIANPDFLLSEHTRKQIKDEYKKLVDEGRIVFTTFHQSMSYEDFIEGIKPKIDEDEDGNKKVIYEVESGIFKRIADKARKPRLKSENSTKPYTFDDAWSDLVLDANTHLEDKNPLVLTIQTPDLGLKIVDVSDKGNLNLKPIYSEDSKIYTVSYSRAEKLQQAFPDLSVIKNVNKEFRAVIGGSNSTAYWSVLNYINTKIKEKSITEVKEETLPPLPHVLIIDEINRGNVSQIFGELITLIEEDKRQGNNEALEIPLPYSKNKFGVPSNLYIIGTMNTADRSVEALDTALRRRFSFEEMPPKPELLNPSTMVENLLWEYKSHEWTDEEYLAEENKLFSALGVSEDFKSKKEGIWEQMKKDKETKTEKESRYFQDFIYNRIDFEKLLNIINNRIEKLIDKDHAIGHAYFIGKDNATIKDSFYKNIIPLLQEYFFGDYGKIGLVLGKGFVKKKVTASSVFATFDDYESEYSERESYEIIDYRKPNHNYKIGETDMDFSKAVLLLMNQAI
ncbi:AAA family ATPase [Chryseobacterium sp. GVT01B]|uniref:AAA family ATPase n=1 Tax=Chryseobacterium sp. GVT01B TaxID=2862675 RepID=UPI001CBB6AC5|nr:AAA family ATPase [Chryseobacterium sp. GVT01B]